MNKVLRYTIEAVDKSVVVVRQAAKNVQNLGNGIRKALGGIGKWAARELNALTESPKQMAIALGLAAVAGRVWNNVIKTMVDRAKEAKKLLAEMVNENLANTLSRQARGYDRLKESIEGAADAAGMLSRAQGSKEQAAGAAAVTGLQAQKAEALAGVSDEGERSRITADYDKRIRAAQIEAKAAEAAREVADAEREAAENAERRKNAEERIAKLSAQVTEENKRLVKAQDAYANEGKGFGDRALASLVTVTSLGDVEKALRVRYRNKAAAEKEVEASQARLGTLSKEIEEARKDLAAAEAAGPAAQAAIDAAKTRLKTVDDEKRIAAAEEDAVKAAKAAAKARKDYADSIRAEADALREQGREHLRAASEYAKNAQALSAKAAAIQEIWGDIGHGGRGAAKMFADFQDDNARAKAQAKEDAKFEKALKRAQDEERHLDGRGKVSKKTQELLDFAKKRDEKLEEARVAREKAEKMRQDEIDARNKMIILQQEIKDLLKRATEMDGGVGGGPE